MRGCPSSADQPAARRCLYPALGMAIIVLGLGLALPVGALACGSGGGGWTLRSATFPTGAQVKPPTSAEPLLTRVPSAAPMRRIGRVRPGLGGLLGGSVVTSGNWAGYDVTGGGFSSVSASWVEPAIQSDDSSDSLASFWVGLDGDGSATAEQTGTAACAQNGRITYYAWYEMYPAGEVPIASLTVSAGDLMTATVTSNGSGQFTLAIADATTHRSFSVTRQTSPVTAPSSAEIVAEAPTDASVGGLLPLADFGKVDFTGCAVNDRPVGAFARRQIDMVGKDGSPLAAASTLSSDGASFSVSASAGDVAPPTTAASGADDLWHNRPVTVTLVAADNPGGSGVAYTEYKLDQGSWTRATSLVVPAPADHSNDGTHTVLYRSVDGAGNAETPRICSVNIATCAPKPVADHAATVARGRTATLAFSVGEPRTGLATAHVTIKVKTPAGRLVTTLTRGAAALNTPLVARFTCRLAAGHYRFFVYATDAAGNTQSSVGANRLTVR